MCYHYCKCSKYAIVLYTWEEVEMPGFTLDSEVLDPVVNIKVVGVGGGGGNALNCMATSGIKDIEFVAVNTDAMALRNSRATAKIQIGAKLTKGRGAGNKPEIGARSAEENKEEIAAAIKGAKYGLYHSRYGRRNRYRCRTCRCTDCKGNGNSYGCGCYEALPF